MEWLILYIKKDQPRHNELFGMANVQASAFQTIDHRTRVNRTGYSRNYWNAQEQFALAYLRMEGRPPEIHTPGTVPHSCSQCDGFPFSAKRIFLPDFRMHVRTERMLLYILEHSSGCPLNRPVRDPYSQLENLLK